MLLCWSLLCCGDQLNGDCNRCSSFHSACNCFHYYHYCRDTNQPCIAPSGTAQEVTQRIQIGDDKDSSSNSTAVSVTVDASACSYRFHALSVQQTYLLLLHELKVAVTEVLNGTTVMLTDTDNGQLRVDVDGDNGGEVRGDGAEQLTLGGDISPGDSLAFDTATSIELSPGIASSDAPRTDDIPLPSFPSVPLPLNLSSLPAIMTLPETASPAPELAPSTLPLPSVSISCLICRRALRHPGVDCDVCISEFRRISHRDASLISEIHGASSDVHDMNGNSLDPLNLAYQQVDGNFEDDESDGNDDIIAGESPITILNELSSDSMDPSATGDANDVSDIIFNFFQDGTDIDVTPGSVEDGIESSTPSSGALHSPFHHILSHFFLTFYPVHFL